jgi:hypothetical protein
MEWSETHSKAFSFGGEEPIEDAIARLRRNTNSIISHAGDDDWNDGAGRTARWGYLRTALGFLHDFASEGSLKEMRLRRPNCDITATG